MAKTYLSSFLGIVKDFEEEAVGIFTRLAGDISTVLYEASNIDGTVPRDKLLEVQIAANTITQRVFVGRHNATESAPLIETPRGEVIPLSPYSRALWRAITRSVDLPVQQHADIMARRMSPTAIQVAKSARGNPFARVREQNPLATYDPPHTWVDPNGYRLSDRIWNSSAATRRHIDAMVENGIRQGHGSLRMSRELEAFLRPDRTLRTARPYGTDASYDSMRLARTEISRAHAQASEVSAMQNPFVSGLSVVLSHSHPKKDICDEAAAASPFPKDDIPARYRIPLHPHCLCHYIYEIVEDDSEQMVRLNRDIELGRAAITRLASPLLREAFTRALLTGGIEEVLDWLP